MPHSTYSKIFDLLSYIRNGNPRDIFELSQEIHDNEIESFAIWRKTEGSNRSQKSFCSPSSIRRLIRFVNILGFIRIEENKRNCRILAIGKNALSGENYSVQLGAQLVKYMREYIGISLEELERVITSLRSPKIADSATLYQIFLTRRSITITEEEFRRLLYLLERCDKIDASVRKIYQAQAG
jgi:hypothetical protein